MYYVYILKSPKTGELYYGVTSDIKRRIVEHNSGKAFSTRSARPWKLIYYEAYRSRLDVEDREYHLKRYGQAIHRLKLRIKRSLLEK
ncbi:MAG: hypothetical protein A2Z88_00630 [Omnitrophica WOR_2 bacterium GWA2_47_8]|nr:MAG: hypothetical protein A2Z88_00630 [Omnitrophica WOR_2 bacterium GWA2_47_8]